MLRITMENDGGELASELALDDVQAVEVLIEMVRACGNLCDGDRFFVRDARREVE